MTFAHFRARMTFRRSHAALCSILLIGCGSSSTDPEGAGGSGGAAGEPEPFFDGVDSSGIEFVGVAPSDLSFEDGVVKCKCTANGYLYKNDSYRNFVLTLQFRFERPAALAPGDDDSFTGNAGYFVHLSPPHQVWPSCLEVQGSYQETGDVFRLPGLLPGNDNPDVAAIDTARRPVGEWNDLRVTSQDGALAIDLNGVRVNESTPSELTEGLVALESEGAEVHWRDVGIQRLP